MEKKAYLVLANGDAFEGTRFGAEGTPTGELVFTTGMTGYMETLSDPSYYGQMVMHTFPLIGNYGVIREDMESPKSFATAYIVREHCKDPSNFRMQGDLDTFLKEENIPGLYGVDTRAITRIIREAGVMNARIVDKPTPDSTDGLAEFRIRDAVKAVGGGEAQTVPADGEQKFRVVLLDCGAKGNIAQTLKARGCEVLIVPCNTTAEEMLALSPNGIMLSNGPGDPAENTAIIAEIKKLIGQIPLFGICLGHQLLALASGLATTKLKYGHRGANQPVKALSSGRVYITSQNHGYAVVADNLPEHIKLSMVNVNDNTCEGLDYPAVGAFSVQFHPEASAGPLDTGFLFDRFLQLMEGEALCR